MYRQQEFMKSSHDKLALTLFRGKSSAIGRTTW